MSVGHKLSKSDLDAQAYNLLQAYLSFSRQAQAMATLIAPYSNAEFASFTGYSQTEADTFRVGANTADALRKVSEVNGVVDANLAQTASQVATSLAKFEGVS